VDSFAPEVVALAAAIAALAGVVRAVTGFGGAMVMSPPMALLLGPVLAVPTVMLLEGIAAAPMLVSTRHQVRWKVIGPIILVACITVPLGTYVLLHVDPQVMRRVIAGVVIVFSLMLLKGWRYTGQQRLRTSLGLAALSGPMVGATGMGGPPVILYLLAGPDPIETTRANLTYFVGSIAVASFVALWASGAVGREGVWLALLLTPGYYLGMMAGYRLFAHLNDTRFRQFTLIFMMTVAAFILVA
jgi:uncharacterized membrane protein YfcA